MDVCDSSVAQRTNSARLVMVDFMVRTFEETKVRCSIEVSRREGVVGQDVWRDKAGKGVSLKGGAGSSRFVVNPKL